MSSEIQFLFKHGGTCYFTVRNRVGQIWNTSSGLFEAYNAANWANYAVSTTEQGSSATFAGNFPSTIVAGIYGIVAISQIGGTPAETDTPIASGEFQWNGTVSLPLSDLVTSGQFGQNSPIPIYRGQMVKNFPIRLVSSADHVTPLTSGILSGQVSRDGAAFTVLQSGAFTEIGNGFYALQALTSGDLLANTVALLFNGVGISGGISDPLPLSIVLQRTSGF